MIKVKSLECRAPVGARFSLCFGIVGDPFAAGASIINGIFNRRNTDKTNETNLQIARETNQMTLDAMRENNNFSANMAWDMFNAENAYNTPEAQKVRLLAAGFNPASAFANGAANATAASGSVPSAAGATPNFVAPTMQTPPSIVGGAIDSIGKIAQAYKTYKEGQHESKEVDWFDKDMEARLKNLLSETDYNTVQTNYQKLVTVVDSLTLLPRKKAEIKKLNQEIITLAAQGDYVKAQEAVAKAEERVKQILGDREEQSTPIILDNLRKTGEVLKSQAANNYAGAEANKSSARLNNQLVNESESREQLNRQQKQYIDDTKVWTSQILENNAMSGIYDNIVSKETIIERINQIKNLPGLQEETKKILEQQAQLLEKQNSWFNRKATVELIRDICGAYESFTGAFENSSSSVKNITSSAVPFYIGK